MKIIGTIRLLDGAHKQRGTVEVAVDGETVTLAITRDDVPARLFCNPHVADKLSDWLNIAADAARGA